jgi:monoamine oxidase
VFSPADRSVSYWEAFHHALAEVTVDLPIAEFLERSFTGSQFAPMRRAVMRMVEGYDLADPRRASTLAIRDERQAREEGQHGRIAEGYGALVAHLAGECRGRGVDIRFRSFVTAIDERQEGIAARCREGGVIEADGVVLAVPLPVLSEILLPPAVQPQLAAMSDIGFGNVVKILLRFGSMWWADQDARDLSDLGFLRTDTTVPTWWTQYPAAYPVLTGWCPTLRLERASSFSESAFVELGLESLSTAFQLPVGVLRTNLVASQAINWGNDPFAGGAYSYATPCTREAQARLSEPNDRAIFFAGEALYPGPEMGTVEAALVSGRNTARAILAS